MQSLSVFASDKYSFLVTACNFLWLTISRKEVSATMKSSDFSKLWSDPLKFNSESAKRETRAFQIPSQNLYARPLYFIDTEIYPRKYRELLLIPSIKAIRSANDNISLWKCHSSNQQRERLNFTSREWTQQTCSPYTMLLNPPPHIHAMRKQNCCFQPRLPYL